MKVLLLLICSTFIYQINIFQSHICFEYQIPITYKSLLSVNLSNTKLLYYISLFQIIFIISLIRPATKSQYLIHFNLLTYQILILLFVLSWLTIIVKNPVIPKCTIHNYSLYYPMRGLMFKVVLSWAMGSPLTTRAMYGSSHQWLAHSALYCTHKVLIICPH